MKIHPVGAELLHARPTQHKNRKTVNERNHTYGRAIFQCENKFN